MYYCHKVAFNVRDSSEKIGIQNNFTKITISCNKYLRLFCHCLLVKESYSSY